MALSAGDTGHRNIVARIQSRLEIHPNRVKAVQHLLKNHACDVVISDDGLQHYAMGRDLEIALVDAARGFGNKCLLPAGPLREPLSRLATVDLIVSNGSDTMKLVPGTLRNVSDLTQHTDLGAFAGRTVHAVAGIGNPSRFFAMLRHCGYHDVVEHPFPDHHAYKAKDLQFAKDAVVVMTEKDAVKCQTFANECCWFLPVVAEMSEDLGPSILQRLSL